MHHDFNPRAARKYWAVQEHEACTLLRGLLLAPDNFLAHIDRSVPTLLIIKRLTTQNIYQVFWSRNYENSFRIRSQIRA